jgi:hypothetical protein
MWGDRLGVADRHAADRYQRLMRRRCGFSASFDKPRIVEAYRTMIIACRPHDKLSAWAAFPPGSALVLKMGTRFVLSGRDAGFMMAAAIGRALICARCFHRSPWSHLRATVLTLPSCWQVNVNLPLE